MPGKFIIDNLIIFDADSRTLSLIKKPSEQRENNTDKVVLHTPTADCLMLLIEHQGELLTQSDILNRVWISKGVVVSSGTVYQNISLLRRAFVQLGLTGDIVATLPRRGIMLPFNILITPYSQSLAPADTHVPSRFPRTGAIPPLFFFLLRNKRVSALSCTLLLMLMTGLLLTHIYAQNNYMDNYQTVNIGDPECHVYLSQHFPDNVLNKILKNKILRCAEQPFNYITVFHGVNRYSVISCEQDIRESTPDCLSRFYQKDT